MNSAIRNGKLRVGLGRPKMGLRRSRLSFEEQVKREVQRQVSSIVDNLMASTKQLITNQYLLPLVEKMKQLERQVSEEVFLAIAREVTKQVAGATLNAKRGPRTLEIRHDDGTKSVVTEVPADEVTNNQVEDGALPHRPN
jgi:hypothetical protein